MPARLMIVTDTFRFQDGRIVLAPPVPSSLIDGAGEGLKPGDKLELRRPDGTVLQTALAGFEWPSPSVGGLCISLGTALTKADVPVGTEIWKVS